MEKRRKEDNLLKGDEKHKLTAEEASKGGKASAEARRQKRDLRKAIETLLESDVTDKKTGKVLSGAEAIAVAQFKKALRGDDKAFRILGEYAGQKPVEKVEQVNIDAEYLSNVDEMKAFLDGTGEN